MVKMWSKKVINVTFCRPKWSIPRFHFSKLKLTKNRFYERDFIMKIIENKQTNKTNYLDSDAFSCEKASFNSSFP